MSDPIADEVKRLLNEAVYHKQKQGIRIRDIEQRIGTGSTSWYSWVEGRCYPSLYTFVNFLQAMGLRLRIERRDSNG